MEQERHVAFEQPTKTTKTQNLPPPPPQTPQLEVLPPLTDLSQAPVLPYINTSTSSHQGGRQSSNPHVSFFGQRDSDSPKGTNTIMRSGTPRHQTQAPTFHRSNELDPSTLIAQVCIFLIVHTSISSNHHFMKNSIDISLFKMTKLKHIFSIFFCRN